jgi:uncharacterized lipoprotein YmbA
VITSRKFQGTSLLACIAVTALLAACGSSPSVRYYTLSPEAKTSSSISDLALKIGPAEFPRELARSQIVSRAGATRLNVDEYNVWAAPLEKQFLRVLGDDLGTRLGTHRIAVYPTEAAFPVDYQLLLDVLQFDGVKGDSVTLRVRWSILKADGSTVEDGLFSQDQSATGDNYDAMVAAHSALVDALAKTLSTQLERLADKR